MTDPEQPLGVLWRIDALVRQRVALVWVTLAVFAAIGAFVYGLRDVYRTSATLLVEGAMPEVAGASLAADTGSRLQTVKQQALGRAQLSDLVDRFDLYDASEGDAGRARAIEQLERDIRVDPLQDQTGSGATRTIAFRVSYVGADPKTAADVTNALAAYFVEQNDQLRTGQASRATELLAAEVAEARRELEGKEARVRSYSTANLGALPQQIEANLAAIARLDAQLRLNGAEELRLIERRQELQAELATIGSTAPSAEDVSPQGQLARLESDLVEMRRQWGPEYPDVRAAQAQIERLRRSIATAGPASAPAGKPTGRSPSAAHQQALKEVDEQLARIASENTRLTAEIAGYERRVESTPAHAPAFEGLMRDFQATRDRLDTLQKRYDEARLTERAERGGVAQEFRILDPALPPTAAAGPSRVVLGGLGLCLALLCGVAVALIRDRADSSFHTVDDLRRFTSVPVFASIPEIAPRQPFARRLQRTVLAGAGVAGIAVLASGAFYAARASDEVSRLLSRVL